MSIDSEVIVIISRAYVKLDENNERQMSVCFMFCLICYASDEDELGIFYRPARLRRSTNDQSASNLPVPSTH